MSKLAEYSNIIDRSLDRLENAVKAARSGTYSSDGFTRDVAASWNDWALFAALPLSVFGLDISVRPAIPTLEFMVTDKTVKPTLVVQVPQVGNITGVKPQNLTRYGTTDFPFIPADKVNTALAGAQYLFVTLDSPGINALRTVPANVYQGDVLKMPDNVTIATVKVVWPG